MNHRNKNINLSCYSDSEFRPFEASDLYAYWWRIQRNWTPAVSWFSLIKLIVTLSVQLAVIGNVLSLIAFFRLYRNGDRPFIHQITIAINDLGASLSGLLYLLTNDYFLNLREGYPPIFCYSSLLKHLQPIPRQLCLGFSLSSNLLLAFVSFDRTKGISARSAFRYRYANHERRALVSSLLIYAVSFSFAFSVLHQSFPWETDKIPMELVRKHSPSGGDLDIDVLNSLSLEEIYCAWKRKFGVKSYDSVTAGDDWSWQSNYYFFTLPGFHRMTRACRAVKIPVIFDILTGAALTGTCVLFFVFNFRLAVYYRMEMRRRRRRGGFSFVQRMTNSRSILNLSSGTTSTSITTAPNHERSTRSAVGIMTNNNDTSTNSCEQMIGFRPQAGGSFKPSISTTNDVSSPASCVSSSNKGPVSEKTLTTVLFAEATLAFLQISSIISSMYANEYWRQGPRHAVQGFMVIVCAVQLSTSFWWFIIMSANFRVHLKKMFCRFTVGDRPPVADDRYWKNGQNERETPPTDNR